MTTETAFTGIHAILYALFDAQERLDREAMRRQVEICLEHGAHGVAALGLATEVSGNWTVPERRTVMEWTSEDGLADRRSASQSTAPRSASRSSS